MGLLLLRTSIVRELGCTSLTTYRQRWKAASPASSWRGQTNLTVTTTRVRHSLFVTTGYSFRSGYRTFVHRRKLQYVGLRDASMASHVRSPIVLDHRCGLLTSPLLYRSVIFPQVEQPR